MKYKLSNYSIFSKLSDSSKYIVYNTVSGEICVITDIFYYCLINDLIDQIPQKPLQSLIEKNIIVEYNKNELVNIIEENEVAVNSPSVLYEVIQPSANCQLGCYYCGQTHTKDAQTDEIIDLVAQRIIHKFNTGNYTGIYMGWFGGEAIMGLQQMRKLNKKIKQFCEEKKCSYSGKVASNGLSLKEGIFKELLQDFQIDQIEVTLDGVAEYHDQHRYLKSGEKSFDIIYENLKSILLKDSYDKSKCRITIRCNVDEKNVDGVLPLIEMMAKDGMHKQIGYFYPVGVYSWGGNDAHKKSLTKQEFGYLQIQWYIRMYELGFYESYGIGARKKITCVAVGGPSEMYDAFGNVFNCTEVSYSDNYNGTPYVIGNLKDDYLATFKNKPLNDWNETIKNTTNYPCHKCKILPVCGGACPKSWIEGMPACPPKKYTMLKDLEMKYIFQTTPKSEISNKLNEFGKNLKKEEINCYWE